MSLRRLIAVAIVFGASLFVSEAALGQGCTAQRGCPTIPPSIPGGMSAATRTPPYALMNNFYASTEAANYEARPSAPTANDDVPADKALIRVSVPAEDAVVSFQGVRSRQQGKDRLFASPVLSGGREYRYLVRCDWTEEGRRVSREQRVLVRPGEETAVEFVAAR
ncbi:MAG TPA: TIGR03000 domain-containing protein [Pirellulaceae bacterium]|nr:TIGR03000 domain-containing protein [Pirellulaceae bacterium]